MGKHISGEGLKSPILWSRKKLKKPLSRWETLLIGLWLLLLPWVQMWRLWRPDGGRKYSISGPFLTEHVEHLRALWESFWGIRPPMGDVTLESSLLWVNPFSLLYGLYVWVTGHYTLVTYQVLLMLQISFLAWGMFLYLRSLGLDAFPALLGSSFLAMCGFVPSFYTHPVFWGFVWLPWVLWAIERFFQAPDLSSLGGVGLFLFFGLLGGSIVGILWGYSWIALYLLLRVPRLRGVSWRLWGGYALLTSAVFGLCGGLAWWLWLSHGLTGASFSVRTWNYVEFLGFMSPMYGIPRYHGVMVLPWLFWGTWGKKDRGLHLFYVGMLLFGVCLGLANAREGVSSLHLSFLWGHEMALSEHPLFWMSPALSVLIALGMQRYFSFVGTVGGRLFWRVLFGVWIVWLLWIFWGSFQDPIARHPHLHLESFRFLQWLLFGSMLGCLSQIRRRRAWGWGLLFLSLWWIDVATYHRRAGMRASLVRSSALEENRQACFLRGGEGTGGGEKVGCHGYFEKGVYVEGSRVEGGLVVSLGGRESVALCIKACG
ncbi:MAG: hypothetical protein H6728_06680 [Myxococcales bacterium]|nr:hypothetical protein [Myxococcales bacterium]